MHVFNINSYICWLNQQKKVFSGIILNKLLETIKEWNKNGNHVENLECWPSNQKVFISLKSSLRQIDEIHELLQNEIFYCYDHPTFLHYGYSFLLEKGWSCSLKQGRYVNIIATFCFQNVSLTRWSPALMKLIKFFPAWPHQPAEHLVTYRRRRRTFGSTTPNQQHVSLVLHRPYKSKVQLEPRNQSLLNIKTKKTHVGCFLCFSNFSCHHSAIMVSQH